MTINEGIEIAQKMGISIKPEEISAKEKIIREGEGKPWGKEDFLSAMKDVAVELLCKNCEPEQTANQLDTELIKLAEYFQIEPAPSETDSEIDEFFCRCEGKLDIKNLHKRKVFCVETPKTNKDYITTAIMEVRLKSNIIVSLELAEKLYNLKCYAFNGRVWVISKVTDNGVKENKIAVTCIRGTDQERLIQKKEKTA